MNLRQMVDLQTTHGDLNRLKTLQAGGPGSGPHAGFASAFHKEMHDKIGRVASSLSKQGWGSHANAFKGMQSDLASGKDFSSDHATTLNHASNVLSTSDNSTAADKRLSDKVDDIHEAITNHFKN